MQKYLMVILMTLGLAPAAQGEEEITTGMGGGNNAVGQAEIWPGAGEGKCAKSGFEHPFVEVHNMGKSSGRSAVQETIVHISDLDGDRDLDVITTVYKDDNTTEAGWHKNLGNGKFTYTRITGEGLRRKTSIAVADIDGDGDVDIVHGNHDYGNGWPGGLEVYENLGKARAWKEHWLTKEDSTSVFAGDLDGDGANDIVVMKDDKYQWMSNQAKNGSKWAKRSFGDIDKRLKFLALHDFDADGDADFLFRRGDSEFGWLESTKKGRRWKKHVLDSTGGIVHVSLIDFDGDGDMDVVAGADRYVKGVFVFANVDGKGNFAKTKVLERANYMSGGFATAADLDGDKVPEILMGHAVNTNGLHVFKYNAKKQACLKSVAFKDKLYNARHLKAADMDGDGDLDLLFSRSRQNLYWVENSSK